MARQMARVQPIDLVALPPQQAQLMGVDQQQDNETPAPSEAAAAPPPPDKAAAAEQFEGMEVDEQRPSSPPMAGPANPRQRQRNVGEVDQMFLAIVRYLMRDEVMYKANKNNAFCELMAASHHSLCDFTSDELRRRVRYLANILESRLIELIGNSSWVDKFRTLKTKKRKNKRYARRHR
ncbi:hypothetical protein TKK_0019035 [Trichogramma kaykai]